MCLDYHRNQSQTFGTVPELIGQDQIKNVVFHIKLGMLGCNRCIHFYARTHRLYSMKVKYSYFFCYAAVGFLFPFIGFLYVV